MKYYIIITFLILNIISNKAIAQNIYDDFFLPFEFVTMKVSGGEILAIVKILNDKIIIDEKEIGSIMPEYSESNEKVNYIGKVYYDPANSGLLYIKLEESEENIKMIAEGNILIKIRASLEGVTYRSHSYEMNRLNVKMVDLENGENILKEYEVGKYTSERGNELKILKRLEEESEFVAGEMRGQMDAPEVDGGRFKHQDVFSAMEMATDWDVRSFLIYVKENPFKYQGSKWKFSEIFATWLASGTPTVQYDLEDLASRKWGIDFFFTRFFIGESEETYKDVISYLRSEAGTARENGNYERTNLLLKNADILAKEINDLEEFAWNNYQKGKLLSVQDKDEEAIELYKRGLDYFEKHEDKAGLIILGNDMSFSYNKIQGKSNYKKAIDLLENATTIAEKQLSKDKSISPIIALMYRNMGNSYKGLKKYDKALDIYNKALTYTNVSSTNALKRKSIILMEISETYELLGNKKQAESYSGQSILAYKEYETVLEKIKKL